MEAVLRDPSFSSSPAEHSIAMLSEFMPDEQQYALVLDDMHMITNGEILKSLPIVRERPPHSFMIFVLIGAEPTEDILEMEQKGKSAIITPELLRFSKEEIQDFFQNMGRFLSPKELSTAQLYTDG